MTIKPDDPDPSEELTRLWRAWKSETPDSAELERPRPEFGIVTEAQVAAQYDQTSGVPGWTAKLIAGKFELTPPPGYTVVESADGAQRLVKIDWSKYSVRIGKTNE